MNIRMFGKIATFSGWITLVFGLIVSPVVAQGFPTKSQWQPDGPKKYDWQTDKTQRWEAPKGCCVSKTPFALCDNAINVDDGYLVTYVTNQYFENGEYAIFEARKITTVPICRNILPGHIPMGIHALWTPQSDLQVPGVA